MPSHPNLKAMAQKIAAITASVRDRPRTRHMARCPLGREGEAAVLPNSLCFAAEISASLLQEKDDSP